ncbi:protein of unknown function [Rhodovastum atsumiense]|nr:protein of unknown function [Rhodovastum atsumiense]
MMKFCEAPRNCYIKCGVVYF